MSDFEIKVTGQPRKRRPEGLLKRSLRRLGRGVRAVLLQPRRLILGLLNITLLQAINESGWKPPEEIKRLYDGLEPPKYEPDMDDEIPF